MRIRVHVSGQAKLGQLARRLRAAANGGMQRDLTESVQATGPPVLAKVRRTVRTASFPATPSRGGTSGSDLRDRLANATGTVPLDHGVRFRVDGEQVGSGGMQLAMLTDTELAPRWNHPVHGHKRRRVAQRGQPWFFAPIRDEDARFVRAAENGIDKTIRKLG